MKTELQNWLTAYENGEKVKSVTMGGLSVGYENAIQSLAVEMIRTALKDEIYKHEEDSPAFISIMNGVCEKASKKLESAHGFSGAQFGAAKNIFAVFFRQTPEKGIAMMQETDPSRIIEIWKLSDLFAESSFIEKTN